MQTETVDPDIAGAQLTESESKGPKKDLYSLALLSLEEAITQLTAAFESLDPSESRG